jgi:hypothetical protein
MTLPLLNITVILPDNRVLFTKREFVRDQWDLSATRYIRTNEVNIDVIDSVLELHFGWNVQTRIDYGIRILKIGTLPTVKILEKYAELRMFVAKMTKSGTLTTDKNKILRCAVLEEEMRSMATDHVARRESDYTDLAFTVAKELKQSEANIWD